MRDNNSTAPTTYSKRYKQFVLFMLTGMYAINFIDRQILNILAEPIKKELHITDTQLGMLSGTTFAFFFVIMGIPLARLADKFNRKNIITLALIFWSLFTALSSMAGSFFALLLIRIGVGIGEAGASPPATAMLSDYYPLAKRATAISIYSAGIYIGITIGFLLGGWIHQYFGWRTAFVVVGLPGIVYALVFWLTVKEPARGYYEHKGQVEKATINFKEGLRILIQKKAFVYLCFACAAAAFSGCAVTAWLAPFFSRIYGIETGQIGTILSLTTGIAGTLTCFFGGAVTDRLAALNKRWYLWFPALTSVFSIPFFLVFLFNHSLLVAGICLFISNLGLFAYIGPSIATTHTLVAPQMRAFSTAVLFFVLNIIGLGLGPLTIGWISDLLHAQFRNASIKFALSCTCLVSLVAALLFYKASKYFDQNNYIADSLRKDENKLAATIHTF